MPQRLNAILAALASITLMGCGGALDSVGSAELRAINAISSPSAVDVFTDVNAVGINLEVGEAGGFTSHPAQSLGVTVRTAGTTTILISGNLNLGSNQRYTLFPYQTGSSTYDMIALIHNPGTIAAGKFKLRAVHLDRFGGSVDVYYAPDGADLSSETPVIQDLGFEDSTGYLELDASVAREITVTVAGTTTPVGNAILITAGSGTAKTLLLFDDGGASAAVYSD